MAPMSPYAGRIQSLILEFDLGESNQFKTASEQDNQMLELVNDRKSH